MVYNVRPNCGVCGYGADYGYGGFGYGGFGFGGTGYGGACYDYCAPVDAGFGYGAGYGGGFGSGGNFGSSGSFALIVVLFILLIIVGAAWF